MEESPATLEIHLEEIEATVIVEDGGDETIEFLARKAVQQLLGRENPTLYRLMTRTNNGLHKEQPERWALESTMSALEGQRRWKIISAVLGVVAAVISATISSLITGRWYRC